MEAPELSAKVYSKMKKKKTYSYRYDNLTLSVEVSKRFRRFSKKVAQTHSATLAAMLNFFEWHNYSPHQRFAKDLSAGQEVNRKRIEAGIAISKSIEKAQNIPLTSIETMLKSLFQEEHKTFDPKALEAENSKVDTAKTKKEKTTVSRMVHDRAKQKLNETRNRLQYVLDKIEPVSNRFGKDFLKIEITREELARFKRALKDS